MNATVEDLRATIIPRSDQLNSEQLMFGAMDITVTGVDVKSGEQPVAVHYEGEAGRPYRPCLTMRKLLVHAWGENGNNWIGRSMRLYCDPSVRFGKDEVGGIRISHLTDIQKDIRVSLTATKGKKALHEIKRMAAPASGTSDAVRAINEASTLDELKSVFTAAYRAAKDEGAKGRLKVASDMRKAALILAAGLQRIADCTDLAVLQLIGDEVEQMPEGEDRQAMLAALKARDAVLAEGAKQ